MTPVVSGERGIATWLTGAAGLLLLAVAVVMMVAAAPGRPASPHAATPSTAVPNGEVTLSTDATMVRACRAGPPAVSAWAEPYTPP